ncbi:hypothetical protein SDC9_158663 [bioreactor metagenome]|uniref:Uncharacterized protein n=1 Tax=bioreactor metagenome TaxID=1076179 RepID=A0A645FCX5_9ZZZZ
MNVQSRGAGKGELLISGGPGVAQKEREFETLPDLKSELSVAVADSGGRMIRADCGRRRTLHGQGADGTAMQQGFAAVGEKVQIQRRFSFRSEEWRRQFKIQSVVPDFSVRQRPGDFVVAKPAAQTGRRLPIQHDDAGTGQFDFAAYVHFFSGPDRFRGDFKLHRWQCRGRGAFQHRQLKRRQRLSRTEKFDFGHTQIRPSALKFQPQPAGVHRRQGLRLAVARHRDQRLIGKAVPTRNLHRGAAAAVNGDAVEIQRPAPF